MDKLLQRGRELVIGWLGQKHPVSGFAKVSLQVEVLSQRWSIRVAF
jgi:hypothetical protein